MFHLFYHLFEILCRLSRRVELLPPFLFEVLFSTFGVALLSPPLWGGDVFPPLTFLGGAAFVPPFDGAAVSLPPGGWCCCFVPPALWVVLLSLLLLLLSVVLLRSLLHLGGAAVPSSSECS